jgi:hypothetical protein
LEGAEKESDDALVTPQKKKATISLRRGKSPGTFMARRRSLSATAAELDFFSKMAYSEASPGGYSGSGRSPGSLLGHFVPSLSSLEATEADFTSKMVYSEASLEDSFTEAAFTSKMAYSEASPGDSSRRGKSPGPLLGGRRSSLDAAEADFTSKMAYSGAPSEDNPSRSGRSPALHRRRRSSLEATETDFISKMPYSEESPGESLSRRKSPALHRRRRSSLEATEFDEPPRESSRRKKSPGSLHHRRRLSLEKIEKELEKLKDVRKSSLEKIEKELEKLKETELALLTSQELEDEFLASETSVHKTSSLEALEEAVAILKEEEGALFGLESAGRGSSPGSLHRHRRSNPQTTEAEITSRIPFNEESPSKFAFRGKSPGLQLRHRRSSRDSVEAEPKENATDEIISPNLIQTPRPRRSYGKTLTTARHSTPSRFSAPLATFSGESDISSLSSLFLDSSPTSTPRLSDGTPSDRMGRWSSSLGSLIPTPRLSNRLASDGMGRWSSSLGSLMPRISSMGRFPDSDISSTQIPAYRESIREHRWSSSSPQPLPHTTQDEQSIDSPPFMSPRGELSSPEKSSSSSSKGISSRNDRWDSCPPISASTRSVRAFVPPFLAPPARPPASSEEEEHSSDDSGRTD